MFDLDGTLTVPRQDFRALRAALDLPPGGDLIDLLDAHPQSAALWAQVDAWEQAHAAAAEPMPGAAELLAALRDRGARVGVLTRNTARTARTTLDVIGLAGFIGPDDLLGRGCCPPKPAPDGVLRHLARWGLGPADGVMVGDFRDDVACGQAAGVATVLVDGRQRFPDGGGADLCVPDLATVTGLLRR